MVEVFTHGEMEEDMRENINMIRSMVKEYTYGQMEDVFICNILEYDG